jgi:hypothetical protein
VFQQPNNKAIGSYESLLESYLIREETDWTAYKIRKLNEDKKSVVADNIVTKLFNDIKSKSLTVDFAPIDVTKGDIKKLKNYSALENGIKYLNKVAESNKEMKTVAEELQMALNTVIKYRREFESGFRMNNSLVRFVYNGIVVGLIQGTSFVVAESVEFVKDNINLYKAQVKPTQALLKNNHIKGIIQFNQLERKGQFVKFFKDIHSLNENAFVSAIAKIGNLGPVGSVISVIGIIGFVLSFTRSFIFVYYNSRVRLTQYLKHLQDFVLMNASTLGNDAKSTREKQEKIAEQLGKLADIISVDQNVSNDRARSQEDESNKVIALDNKDSDEEQGTDLDLY